jgi:hypothetical protein
MEGKGSEELSEKFQHMFWRMSLFPHSTLCSLYSLL